ncbi:uncharacterized protein ARMOST_19176 [Armillaria ostoyae]|uniref:F-box domain-containing protein n=1 Tax=Armillaria ostoyae TaxID=47428 RepID=A0A284S3T5_ARMOS|nr:uncharacterized protein ARMOST_19176 [Armillaria ostoyae]
MHHALLIPELVHEILQHVSKKDLGCHVSTVCKRWFDVSAKIIWRTLHDLTPLLRLIGEIEMQDDGNTFVDICNFRSLHEDWTRFEIYSRYIRILYLGNSVTDYRPALSAIAMLRSGAVFLPNLQELGWAGYEDWMASVFIMHNSVTSFYLSLEDIPADVHVQAPDTLQFSRALELLIPKLPNLKSIRFPPFSNTFPIISAASALSHLTDIRTADFYGFSNMSLLPSGPPCILPSRLEILHVVIAFRDATRLFYTALPHLSEIQIISGYAEVPLTVSHLAMAISQYCSNLRKLYLSSARTQQGMTGVADDCLAIADIAPLFSCSAMTESTIQHAYPLPLHDSDIQTLLTRWPALEHLMLNNFPPSLLARGVSVPLPEWSTLALFARYGKHLSSLGLYMNGVANIPDIGNSCPFTHLEAFDVGNSPTLGTPAEARFLSYILPPNCRLLAYNTVKWGPVVTLMSEFRKARAEEREAKSDLEREVVELRARLAS